MMIDLTVKTLDSQNHAFSLADDITIREFKEHIAETVSVPADSQRLIYCGRVLQDEKRLSEYDVNGKVIHLVQRAPPQSAQRGNSGGQGHGQNRGRGDQPQPQRTHHRQTRRQFHGNPMYLGSISIPAEVVEGHEWPIPQLSNTLSNSRLVVARRMFDQANRVLDRLDNPAAAATTSDSNVPQTDEPTSGGGAAASESSQQDDTANAAELSRRYYVVRSGEEGSGTEPSAPAAETSDESQTQDSQQQLPRQGGANASGDPGCPRVRPLATPSEPRTPQMAQLVGRLMDTQDRLRPYLTRYRELMELDPEIPGGRTASGDDIGSVEENQRLTDGVTECLHFLSHANHALSDMIVDCGQEPPRNLRCRPVLIQHSAILQAGIPIQVEAHISVARNEGSNGESGEENTESTNRQPPTSATNTPPSSQYPVELTFVTEQDQPAPNVGQQSEQQQAQNQPQVDSPFGDIFTLTNNMEVLMEMGPPESVGISVNAGIGPTGTEQSSTTGSNNNNNNNNNNNAPGMSGVAGIFPWGPTPPPEVIRNLMNVVAGYMAQGAATVTTAAPTTMTSTPTSCLRQRATVVAAGGGTAPNPGQSTQARSNVGTHPTTSTQTRSTPRPHVFHPQAHPLGVGVGMGQNMDFDLFLPCNSHHIHRTPSSTPNNSAATSSPQQTSQPSQSTTPTGTAQTQPDGPSVPADQNAASTITSSSTSTTTATTTTNADRGSSNTCLRDEIANARRTNAEATASTATLEELLLSRGINVMWSERSAANLPQVLRRLFTACAKIELSEWYALLRDGKFSRDDTWRRLRPHITSVILFNSTNKTRSRFDTTTPPGFAERLSEQIIRELQPYLSESFENDEGRTNPLSSHRINFPATIEYFVYRFVKEVSRYLETNVNTVDDDEWGTNLAKIVQRFGRELCTMLQTSLHRKQAGLEDLIRNFATRAMSGHHGELREWVVGTVANWFCEYSRQMAGVPGVFHHIIAYELSDSEETSGSDETADAARSQGAHSQPEPEPMETEEVTTNRTITDPLELDDGQEVPTTFPGHENLLPEWVPIIARDSIGQRRQLQLQGTGVTAFSDAYLDGLPSKRRKLVESQKPRLLVSPTPNHSSIPASIERLVRDSVVRAGVEEADGAAAAVAADSGVRRAFGQAIRECLHPRRLQTPDFPNSRRFPNATSYFTDKEKAPKQ